MAGLRQSEQAVIGGFVDPVFDAQAVFRALLDATARPGTVRDLGGTCEPPAPLGPAQGAILLAFSDMTTPVFVEAERGACAAWLGFHTGAALVDAGAAHFAVLREFGEAALDTLPLGTLAYPDRSATVLVETESLTGGDALALSGPGIDGRRTIAPAGLGAGFLAAREANRALFPCGIDLVLTCGSAILALPRSTTVEEV
ncbi:phosphonate C-P lyase system protein PhnH [Jiella marina]|uniref:phosphonate C-P lyase system protein PhnH n=1 Tax=Jiella sp. LLJ827 TaxID=2917712 RepID=UPI002100E0E6|nr:phosphonate C-P lyase system protein PhnH [Jiella sp. LLJ827]MCQ0986134.1 phosphonate C-P lyase system protein PhnH [Jiella sp. LLJ827]